MRIAIIGAGVVGAAIAYELSALPNLEIHVFDQRATHDWLAPGTATGAALGVLIAVGSTKQYGPQLELRLASLQRYETLIPELEALTGNYIPFNRQGILELCFDPAAWQKWQRVAHTRQQQGLKLELLTVDSLATTYPSLAAAQALPHPSWPQSTTLQGAVYAPQDRQVDPVRLTQALIAAGQLRGVQFHFQTPAVPLLPHPTGVTPISPPAQPAIQLQTPTGTWVVEGLVIAAGTGSQHLQTHVTIQPVLGQALHLRCDALLTHRPWCDAGGPVIQGADVHLVPLATAGAPAELWVGATVEPLQNGQGSGHVAQPEPACLAQVYQQAVALCPLLQTATVLRQWTGWRPRPQGRLAPVIEPLAGYSNVWLATGHYRNGILLAPITGLKIKQALAAALLGINQSC